MHVRSALRGRWLGLHARVTLLPRRRFSELRGSRRGAGSICCNLPNYKQARKNVAEQRGSTFPFKDAFELGKGTVVTADGVFDLLLPLVGDERLQRFQQVAASRTFNVLPIVEQTYDMGNLAAIIRSADALGCGAVHCIRHQKYKQSKRASGGAEKWLDVQLWDADQTAECLQSARHMGYQIVATHLSPTAVDISEVDWTHPTAFVLGNEKSGVSQTTLEMADQHIVVPMDGFVESYNLSVAAALILYQARATRIAKLGRHGDLSEEEQRILLAMMLLRHRGTTGDVARNLLQRAPPDWQIYRGGGDWGSKFSTPPTPSEVRCHYWDGTTCYGETLLYPGRTCMHVGGHHSGCSTLNKHKLRLMCERKGVPEPAVLLEGGDIETGGLQARAGATWGSSSSDGGSSSLEQGAEQQQQQQHGEEQQEQLKEVVTV